MKKIFLNIKDKIGGNWLFLFFVVFVFLIVWLFNFRTFLVISFDFFDMFMRILPVILLVYIIIFWFNLIISNKKIVQFLKKWSYIRKLIFSVFFWILSSWPIYLWYWLLKQIKDAWLTLWHISSFSYARAIKLPLLPIMISYFGIKFSVLFFVILFVFSFVQALLVDLIYNRF